MKTPAKTYWIYLKSHTEAPDFEDYVEARSKKQALERFIRRTPLLGEFDKNYLYNSILASDEDPTTQAKKKIIRIAESF